MTGSKKNSLQTRPGRCETHGLVDGTRKMPRLIFLLQHVKPDPPVIQRYPGFISIEIGHRPGHAVTDASATGRAKAAATRGSREMSAAVGCLCRRRSPDNPCATEGGTGKAGPPHPVADANR